ncbi:MAG: branched-chain amino acid ABC transporter permease [Hyphomicrobiales bacterium]|nr:branched-chain amino acid ABC transporter permease [Hyphomicrobiales bacterium]
MNARALSLFAVMAALFVIVGQAQSWSVSLTILNLCLISAVMALGVNMQWGYAGLFNAGTVGFAALGGVAAMLISVPPVQAAWAAGGPGLGWAILALLATIGAVFFIRWSLTGRQRVYAVIVVLVVGWFVIRAVFGPATSAIEAIQSDRFGFLGGLGMPILFSWLVGGLLAAGAAWLIGKTALGLRADYLAIATLGISEIIIAVLRNEDWLTRGVKNVTGLPRPVPFEVDLLASPWFLDLAAWLGAEPRIFAGIFVKLCYAGLFAAALLIVLWLSQRALHSPWGRMIRAIRDNPEAAEAMGKDVAGRQLQVFVLGSAVCGIAGAMLTTLDGQFTPGAYNPLRFTFLIWVMVIVGGSGNNLGAVLGGFLIWFSWVQAEPVGLWLVDTMTAGLPAESDLRTHLLDGAAHARLLLMGVILLVVLRFFPRGLLPEKPPEQPDADLPTADAAQSETAPRPVARS